MRPNLNKDKQTAWLVLGGVALLSLITLAVFYDWGGRAEELEGMVMAYDARRGRIQIDNLIDDQKLANDLLKKDILNKMERAKVTQVSPFLVPATLKSVSQKGQFFLELWEVVRDKLREKARHNSAINDFDDSLGFSFPDGRPPGDVPVENWLMMLQLVSKACFIAINHDGREVKSIKITSIGNAAGENQGAPGRLPILREFTFTMEVRCTFGAYQWLLHQFSADRAISVPDADGEKKPQTLERRLDDWHEEIITGINNSRSRYKLIPTVRNTISPLALLHSKIVGENVDPTMQQQEVTAVFRLAGMQFLTEEERKAAGVIDNGRGSRGRIGRTVKRNVQRSPRPRRNTKSTKPSSRNTARY